jgi:hypothetical protein
MWVRFHILKKVGLVAQIKQIFFKYFFAFDSQQHIKFQEAVTVGNRQYFCYITGYLSYIIKQTTKNRVGR